MIASIGIVSCGGFRWLRLVLNGLSFKVPETLRVPLGELEEMLRVELTLRLYEKGIASLDQARGIASN